MSDDKAPPKPRPKRKPRKRRERMPKLSVPLPLNRGGRPPIYDEALCPRVHKFALLGMTDAEIADAIGVTEETINAWKVEHPEFSASLQNGKLNADADIANSLFLRARGGMRMPAVKIFLDKEGSPVYAPYEEVLPPDVGAAKVWLYNRQPGRWRDRREVAVSLTLEQRIAQMTPEERRARLAELEAKMRGEGPLIDGEAAEV